MKTAICLLFFACAAFAADHPCVAEECSANVYSAR